MEQNDNYKGYSLFNDTGDFRLKSRNRGAVMANIFEEHYNTKLGKITALGTALILGYFNALLPFERKAAKDAFNLTLQDRGISCGS